MGQLSFTPEGQLLGNSPLGERSFHSALLQPGQLLSGRTGDADGEIKPILQVFLEEERYLDQPAPVRIGIEAFTPDRKQLRMGQVLEPEPLRVVAKDNRADVDTVDGAIRQDRIRAEPGPQRREDIRTRVDVFSHQGVRIEVTEAEALEQAGRGGFTAPETSRKTKDHASARREGDHARATPPGKSLNQKNFHPGCRLGERLGPVFAFQGYMLATITSAALQGIDAAAVHVECNTGESGEPCILLVGLPDAAVRESRDRVTSAVNNSGFEMPRARMTINLAPADIRKEGPIYDLPIALGLLHSSAQLHTETIGDFIIAGELGLSGTVRPVRGALAMARLARRLGKRGLLLPPVSAAEAALVEGVEVYAAPTLDAAFRFLSGERPLPRVVADLRRTARPDAAAPAVDFAEIKGQHSVRRAVEIAVAGNHNLLLIGPPGAGKSMIAKRIPTIMPPATAGEYLEILSIHSAAGRTLNGDLTWAVRPFRSPHHTISNVGLIGGGTIPGPGEISLAHQGVLFLDELPEFNRSALEVLRQPLEDGEVTLSRSAGKVTLPCSFLLVAAMNPCPCGYLGHGRRECRCTPSQIQRYRARLSGPLLDRLDLHVEAPPLTLAELRSEQPGECSAAMAGRITAARTRQLERFAGTQATHNAGMSHAQIRRHCAIDSAMGDLLQRAIEQFNLSARSYDRILKVSRTISDLAGEETLAPHHLLEAIQYRSLDRDRGR